MKVLGEMAHAHVECRSHSTADEALKRDLDLTTPLAIAVARDQCLVMEVTRWMSDMNLAVREEQEQTDGPVGWLW